MIWFGLVRWIGSTSCGRRTNASHFSPQHLPSTHHLPFLLRPPLLPSFDRLSTDMSIVRSFKATDLFKFNHMCVAFLELPHETCIN